MTQALRPGGWLLIEDFDVGLQPLACPAPTSPAEERANRIRDGFLALLAERGVDLRLGRSLPQRLRSLGLSEIQADAYIPLALPATRDLERANVQQSARVWSRTASERRTSTTTSQRSSRRPSTLPPRHL
jgi:hypothetical protein